MGKRGWKSARAKEARKLFYFLFVAIFLLGLGFFSGCQPQQAAKSGFEIGLISGAGYASEGQQLLESEPFKIGIELTNYDEDAKSGNICIFDDIADYYGGIMQRECSGFSVQGSTKMADKQIPGTQRIIFPQRGTSYSYEKIPAGFDFRPQITIEIQYMQNSLFTTTLTYPEPTEQSFAFGDKFLSLNIKKSVHASSADNYEIFLELRLSKLGNAVIESEGKNNSIRLILSAQPLSLNCQTSLQQFSQSALINLEKENFISCSALTTSREQTSIPFIINLRYIAKEERSFSIAVKKRGAEQR
ncbi:MAG: hypothetical protein QXE64_00620 [Candidatus Pacearchaeota archaeon]